MIRRYVLKNADGKYLGSYRQRPGELKDARLFLKKGSASGYGTHLFKYYGITGWVVVPVDVEIKEAI